MTLRGLAARAGGVGELFGWFMVMAFTCRWLSARFVYGEPLLKVVVLPNRGRWDGGGGGNAGVGDGDVGGGRGVRGVVVVYEAAVLLQTVNALSQSIARRSQLGHELLTLTLQLLGLLLELGKLESVGR